MDETRRHHIYWAILAISFGLTGAMLGAMCGGSEMPSELVSSNRTPDAGVSSSQTTASSQTDSGRPIRRSDSGPLVQFVHPDSREGLFSLVLVGAPGLWPPEARRTDPEGHTALPTSEVVTLNDEPLRDYEVMARAPEQSLGYWKTLTFEERTEGDASARSPRRLPLEPAAPLDVSVVDASGTAVSEADVRLSRRQIGFVHLQKQTDPQGTTTLRALPAGTYRLSASKGARRATRVFEQDVETGRSLTLQLQRTERADIGEEGANDGNSSNAFVPVTVRLEGLSEAQWQRASVARRRRGQNWRNMVLEPIEGTSQRRWTQELQPGTYELKVALDSVQDTMTLEVGSEETTETWTIEPRRMYRIFAVDAFGTPVPGALIQVWRGDRRVLSQTTSGDRPIEIELEHGTSYRVVTFDSRKGEGERMLETDEVDPSEFVVRLDQSLFSASRPPNRVTSRSKLESLLGVSLVKDREAWVLDMRGDSSPAQQAGLERGDRLISLHERGDGYRVIVERDGRIQTASLPK